MPYKMELDLAAVNGGLDYAMLVGKSDIFPFENGKRTSDVRTGVKLNLALIGARMSPLTVKYDHDPLPKTGDDDIAAATSNCQFMFVQIPDCVVNVYASNTGGLGMTASAMTAQLVTLDNSK